jgi:hypothetical protein
VGTIRRWQIAAGRTRHREDCRLKHGNYKSQNSNNKQITMTKIQNSKPQYHFEKRIPNMFG